MLRLLPTAPLWSRSHDGFGRGGRSDAARGFDVAGVAEEPVTRFVRAERLVLGTVADHAEPITAAVIVEKSLPLADFIGGVGDRAFVFVLDEDEVRWIATHADLQAPAVTVVVLSYLVAIEVGLMSLTTRTLGERWCEELEPKARRRAEKLYEKKVARRSTRAWKIACTSATGCRSWGRPPRSEVSSATRVPVSWSNTRRRS